MTPSAIQSQNAFSNLIVHEWFNQTVEVHLFLERVFEQEFPTEYAAQKKRYVAAKWCKVDPGPYLGRAVIYKMVASSSHMDSHDACPTAIFPVGYWTKGHLL